MVRRAWGEGSYDYNDNTGRWRWRGYYEENGEKKRKEIVARNRKQLKEKVTKFLEKIAKEDDQCKRNSIEQWCKLWLEQTVEPATKPRTLAN